VTKPYLTIQDLHNIVMLSEPRFSPVGDWLAVVRTEIERESNDYRSAIWLVPSAGGQPRQFTNGEKRDNTPRWSPDGRWLAFVSNRGDDKAKPQIYVMPTDGGEALRLTELENGVSELAWSPDGRRIAFSSRLNTEEMESEREPEPDTPPDPDEVNRRKEEKEKREKEKADPLVVNRFGYRAGTSFFDDRTAHLYVVDVDPETGQSLAKPNRLTEDERNYSMPRWLPDGSALLAVVDRLPGEDDLFSYPDVVRVPTNGGQLELLTGPDTADVNPRPSPDGQWIAYNSLPVADYTTVNSEIKVIPVGGGEPRIVTELLDGHPREIQWAPDGHSLTFLHATEGRIELGRIPIEGGLAEVVVSGEREMIAYDLSSDGRQVGFVASTDRAPSDLYVASLDSAGRAANEERLTEVNGQWLADRELGEVEDLWFESADGTRIQGWVIKPPGFEPETQYPLILSIHGGPHVMWSRHEPTMWHEWQVQAANGYVVLACNPRGSDGYGQEFRSAARNCWGDADLPDLMAGLDRVVDQGYVDVDRLVITGGSYGGFMTSWVIGHSRRFKAAVAQRGVYDLTTFYSTSDVPKLIEWEFAAAPWEDPEGLWKYSPLAYVEDIHTPLLLIHSENDYRVPIATAEGLFVALRRLRREVELVRYPRDGHELSRSGEPKHRVDRQERILDWFDTHTMAPDQEDQGGQDS
jgi:dipeptidyl aminopeptidase/acylaminoacyl peptidase